MNGISREELERIKQSMCGPEGSFTFEYSSQDLMDASVQGGVIFEIIAGQHFFRLERTNDLLLRLFYSSPGTGTRVSTIDLKSTRHTTAAFIGISWSPNELSLYFGPRNPNSELIGSKGVESSVEFRIGEDGNVYRIGDQDVKVMALEVSVNGETVVRHTAIEAWRNMKMAVEVLGTGRSEEGGYLYEVIVANIGISMLVTGFETYCKARFVELEAEGIIPDSDGLTELMKKEGRMSLKSVNSDQEITRGQGVSVLRKWIIEDRRINFQNFSVCENAYKKVYDIDFTLIFPLLDKIDHLKKFIDHRHNVIHVSAIDGTMNPSISSGPEPVHVNSALLKEALEIFDKFIVSLHEASLTLRPPSR